MWRMSFSFLGPKTPKKTGKISTQQLPRQKERGVSFCGIGGPIGSTVLIGRLHQDRRYRPAVRTANLKHRRIRGVPPDSIAVYRQFDWPLTLDALLLVIRLVIHFFLPQRVLAAFAAIAERFFGVRAAARAAPPFNPPKRPRATAAGFFFFISGGSVFGAWPVDSSMTWKASAFGSRGRVFERSGIADLSMTRS